MAIHGELKANADLTGKVGYIAKVTNGKADLCAAADTPLGVLVNDGKAGETVSVALVGEIVKIKAGAAVTAGAALKANADGKAIPVAADHDKAVAIALQAGAENDLIYAVVAIFEKSVA